MTVATCVHLADAPRQPGKARWQKRLCALPGSRWPRRPHPRPELLKRRCHEPLGWFGPSQWDTIGCDSHAALGDAAIPFAQFIDRPAVGVPKLIAHAWRG